MLAVFVKKNMPTAQELIKNNYQHSSLTEEQRDRQWKFYVNEVSPRIKKYINILKEFDEYKEAVLLGGDLFKMREYGIITNIQARKFLDNYIGKLHANNKTEKSI